MVLSSIVLIVLAANVLPFVQSQSGNTAFCTTAGLSLNNLGQSPCEVASRLGGLCSATDTFNITQLQTGFVYIGPSLNNANECVCSTVFYSMLSACAACQEKNWLRWSTYKINCTTVYTGVFAPGIPPGTSVPAYAYDDVTTSDGFNATTALQESNLPESTALPQATTSVPTTSPNSTAASASNSKSSNHAGAIAGGVIGGVVALAVIAGIAFWFIRRHRSSRIAPSQAYGNVTPMTNASTGAFAAMPPAKLYDPSDPSTFPVSTSTFPTTNATIPSHEPQHPFMTPAHTGGSQSLFTAPGPRYTGAPEL
ncbi:hypothetical protein BDQ12DRAFT_274708 [Crucibulum laeve]|uniref:Mid2 domain-containing protein n=1 Tax=Crucibulum laeve TaxID=68775 RepID=A0A5C3MF09_9AGAR|nr:hypothetical protein BDQ12DRAFT_274708 [Crucibulum laeve]